MWWCFSGGFIWEDQAVGSHCQAASVLLVEVGQGPGWLCAVLVARQDPNPCWVSSDQHWPSNPAERWALSLPSFVPLGNCICKR